MSTKLSCVIETGAGFSERFQILESFLARLRGLLKTSVDHPPVLLLPCSSIHSYFMPYPIDVAFADSHGKVLLSCRGLPPNNKLSCAHAYCSFERPAEKDAVWLEVGDIASIVQIQLKEHKEQEHV